MSPLRTEWRAARGTTVREQAALWVLRETEGRLGEQERARLRHWLELDARHRQAYDAVRFACEATARHAAHPEVLALRNAALACGLEERPRQPAWARAAAVVAGVVLLGATAATVTAVRAPAVSRVGAVAAVFAPTLPPEAALHRTVVGGRSSIVLPDGSVATLNTDSVLKVAYTGAERGVRLLDGQAIFEVAKNRRRPFRVYAGDRLITAVGTVFDVRVDGGEVKVSLVEGKVQVSTVSPRAGDRPAPIAMNPGQVLAAAPQAPPVLQAADIARAVSWREGVVVFDDALLGEAVAEVNRYTKKPLKLSDPQIGQLRVSGVFKSGDPERFAIAMTEVFPLTIDHGWDGSSRLEWAEP